jgi:DNA-binding HxlR family transcriptional regulator
MRNPTDPDCRTIGNLLGRVGDKWTALIVGALGERPMRYNELRRENPSISQRMLTLTLRNLERDGLVRRTVTHAVPPRVDYELTALGLSLLTPITALAQWALDNAEGVHEAQVRYDAEQGRADAN